MNAHYYFQLIQAAQDKQAQLTQEAQIHHDLQTLSPRKESLLAKIRKHLTQIANKLIHALTTDETLMNLDETSRPQVPFV